MQVGSLVCHRSYGDRLKKAFGLILRLHRVDGENVAAVLWNDGMIIDWRYEYFANTPQTQIEVYTCSFLKD